MSTRRKVNRQERRSIEILEAAGYRCSRVAGGLGMWNVIGMSNRGTVLLLVKSRKPDAAELEAIENFSVPADCRKLLHLWDKSARFPHAIEVR